MADYKSIVTHYEDCLEKHGDSLQGVDWPNLKDAETRYEVMLGLMQFDKYADADKPKSLLDFGCGAGHLLEYIRKQPENKLSYSGLDISPKFYDLCRSKFPGVPFYCTDVLAEENELPLFDYMVMNGVFTEKRDLSFEDMFAYCRKLIEKTFPMVKRGIAFNFMSKAVDWERDDLFHMPLDLLQSWLTKELSRHFIIRNDYRLYEFTVYLYH